jgi:hypothetical protein
MFVLGPATPRLACGPSVVYWSWVTPTVSSWRGAGCAASPEPPSPPSLLQAAANSARATTPTNLL